MDADRPNPARMYDYALGGAANFEVDRRAVAEVLKVDPDGIRHARANRAFLRRAVRELVALGVRQFIDLGSGVPTVGHVHEIAQRAAPDARVVYVDNEPVAYRYGRGLLDGVAGTAILPVDLRDAREVLGHPDTRRLIDPDQPVAVLMFAVLHFVLDDREVAELIAAYRDGTAPGSYLAISHACGPETQARQDLEEVYRSTDMPLRIRDPAETAALFDGYQVLPPGVVPISTWRPDPGPDPNRPGTDALVGGIGRRVIR